MTRVLIPAGFLLLLLLAIWKRGSEADARHEPRPEPPSSARLAATDPPVLVGRPNDRPRSVPEPDDFPSHDTQRALAAQPRILRHAAPLGGRCVDSSGRPLAGVHVHFRAHWGREREFTCVADADGRFSREDTPLWAWEVTVADEELWAETMFVAPPRTDLLLTAYRPTRIRGWLHPPAGEDLPPCVPIFNLESGSTSLARMGRFEILVRPGKATLATWVRLRKQPIRTLSVEEGDTLTGVRLALPPDPASSRTPPPPPPPPAERTRSVHWDGRDLDVDISSVIAIFGSGHCARHVPRPNALQWLMLRWNDLVGVVISTSMHGVWYQEAATGGSIRPLRPMQATLSLRLIGEDQVPIAGGLVGLRWQRACLASAPDGWPAKPRDFVAVVGERVPGEEGRHTLRNIGAGLYDLVWWSDECRDAVLLRRDICVPFNGEDLDLGDVALPAPRPLTFRVVDGTGGPIPRALVWIHAGGAEMVTSTDARGTAIVRVNDPTAVRIRVEDYEGRTYAECRLGVDAFSWETTIALEHQLMD